MTIRFSEDDVRPMGRATAGVRGMKLKNDEDGVVSCDVARDDAVMLFVSSSGHGKRTPLDAFNRQGRGGQGVRGHAAHRRDGVRSSPRSPSSPDDEILVFSSAGNIVRMGVDEISEQGRAATGVRVARLAEGDTVVAVARVLENERRERCGDRRRLPMTGTDDADRPQMRPMPATNSSPRSRDEADDRRRGRLTWPSASRSTPNRC